MTKEFRELCEEMVRIADALDNRAPQLANQGQALDGFSALANFRHLASQARTALAAEPPAPAEPDTDAVLTLAAIIRQAAGNGLPGAARLAELILSHPNVARVFQPPAPAPAADGEREELAALIEQTADSHNGLWPGPIIGKLFRAAALLRQPAPAPADLTPVAYDAKAGTRIELTRSTPCPLWAVRSGAYRMSIHGEWSVEPMPSSRTADYLAMHSFPSPAAALAELQRYRKAVASFDGPQPPQGGEVEA